MRKYRLFGVINPFDVLIVAGAAALVFGLSLFAPPQHVLADRGVLIHYEIELLNMPTGFYREVESGTTVVDGIRGFGVGSVVRAFPSPYLMDAPDEYHNIIRRVPVEGRETTHVVIEAWAVVTDYAIEIGPFHLRTGMQIPVRNFSFAGEVFVGAIEFLD